MLPRFSLVQLVALGAFDGDSPDPIPASRFSQADYAAAARALMPRGPAWSDDVNSIQGKTLGALSMALWRNDVAATALLEDAFPATAGSLLPEWEATLGLPDPVLDEIVIPTRRDQVVARLVGAGGQSRQRFIDLAASLGFTITIGNYSPLRVGEFSAGDAVRSARWLNVWSVHVTANSGALTDDDLKAELDAVRPAETIIILV